MWCVGGGVKICLHGISAVLHDSVEEMICREIWYSEEYNINLAKDSIVIDIGLNIGMASLFFANKEYVKKVYAFEPDKRVYEKAIHNISLNEKIRDKIETFNVACANTDKQETYLIDSRESAGIFQRNNVLNSKCGEIEVTCVDAARVLGDIIDQHYGYEKILIKCDCEGAEYEIFYRLEEAGYFDKINAFVMEWHDGRRSEIEKIFERNNFAYIISENRRGIFGLCYAVKI